MPKLVTVAVPLYRRLHFLPQVLEALAAQDYPEIDLLVSDNGPLGEAVERTVEKFYPRPYRIRRNAESVPIGEHFNQCIDAARGEYFILNADDDLLTSTSISDMVALAEREPELRVVLPRHSIIDEGGALMSEDLTPRPEVVTASEFFAAAARNNWAIRVPMLTFLAPTAELRRVGGYPPFPRGVKCEDILLMRLTLGGKVGLAQRAMFRFREDPASLGLTAPYTEWAEANTAFFDLLDNDPGFRAFAREHPEEWASLLDSQRRGANRGYLYLWRVRYVKQLGLWEWLRAPFLVPLSSHDIREVVQGMREVARERLGQLVRRALRRSVHARDTVRHRVP